MYSMYHWSMDWTYFPIKLAKPGIEYSHENLFLCQPGSGLTQPHSQLWCRVKTPSAWGIQRPLADRWALNPTCGLSGSPLACLLPKWIKMWGFFKIINPLPVQKREQHLYGLFHILQRVFHWCSPLTQKVNKWANVVSTGQARDAHELQGSESQAPSALLCSDLTALLPSRWLGWHPGSRPQEAGEPGVWGPTLGPASSLVCKLGQTVWAPVSSPIKWV